MYMGMEQPQGWVLGAQPKPWYCQGQEGAQAWVAVKQQLGGLSAEILGALLSVLSIWVVTGVLVYLAAQRLLSDDYDIEGGVMLITSACAVAVNVMYVCLALALPVPHPVPSGARDVTSALPAGWGWLCTRRGTGTAMGQPVSSSTPASVLPLSTSWGTCCRVLASSLHPTLSFLRSGWLLGTKDAGDTGRASSASPGSAQG